jgi:fluoride exporter
MGSGILWVAAGGALGSVGRHLVSLAAARWLGAGFPWGTLTVNIAGSFAMGVVMTWIVSTAHDTSASRLFLATGILGGFTTFSAFSLDLIRLIEQRAFLAAASYAGVSVLVSLLAIALGLSIARALWT